MHENKLGNGASEKKKHRQSSLDFSFGTDSRVERVNKSMSKSVSAVKVCKNQGRVLTKKEKKKMVKKKSTQQRARLAAHIKRKEETRE